MNTISSTNSAPISFGLAGRICIVTGGAQGIGEACIRRFAREGARIVIADIDDSRGQALASELGGLYVRCDVGDKAQVDALVAQTMAAYGRIDVLVNNAGIFKAADFLDGPRPTSTRSCASTSRAHFWWVRPLRAKWPGRARAASST